jgi:hypothetical protein
MTVRTVAVPCRIDREPKGDLAEGERAEVGEHRKIPMRKPKSPMRLTMKAFLPASAAEVFDQNRNR